MKRHRYLSDEEPDEASSSLVLSWPSSLTFNSQSFKNTPRPVLFLCFLHRFLFSFVRMSILLDDFLHKWIKWTIKWSGFWVWLRSSHFLCTWSVNKGCGVQNHTTACRKLDLFLSFPGHWPEQAEQGQPRESIYCVFFWTLGTVNTAFLRLRCISSIPWN